MERRTFIGLGIFAVTGGVGATAAYLYKKYEQDPTIQINNFDNRIGNKPLSLEDAQVYLPSVARLYVDEAESPLTPDFIIQNTFFVRRTLTPEEQAAGVIEKIYDNPKVAQSISVVKQLREDYPKLDVTDELAKMVVHSVESGVYGLVRSRRIFIFLNYINQSRPYEEHPISGEAIPFWQYKGWGSQVSCVRRVPVVVCRSTLLHEIGHLDGGSEADKPLEQEVVDAYKRVDPFETLTLNNRQVTGKKGGFNIRWLDRDRDFTLGENALDEIVTDYKMARISTSKDLNYETAYIVPFELANLDAVLRQANIHSQIFEIHRQSDIKSFLMAIGNEAKNIELPTEEDKLDFSVARFLQLRLNGPINRPVIWTELAPYFEGMDLSLYQYVNPKRLMFPMFYTSRDAPEYDYTRLNVSCVGVSLPNRDK